MASLNIADNDTDSLFSFDEQPSSFSPWLIFLTKEEFNKYRDDNWFDKREIFWFKRDMENGY